MKYWIGYEEGVYVIRDDNEAEIFRSYSRASAEQFYQELIAR